MAFKSGAQRLFLFLGRPGIIPATSVISLITTSNTAQYFFENPLTSTFHGVLFGGIGGGIIESLTPPQARAFVSGGILLATGVAMAGRSIGWINSPTNNTSPVI